VTPAPSQALAVLAALMLASCGGGELAVESQTSEASKAASIPASLTGLLHDSASAPFRTAYRGLRHVEQHLEQDGVETLLSYRETVAADGTGRFAVEPQGADTFLPDPLLFKLQQKARAGFLYRYRDFAIRDFKAFSENYLATDLDLDVEVAGRPCHLVQIERVDGTGSIYKVALDLSTGLVLRCEERGVDGAARARMEFETFEAEPNLDGVAWFAADPEEEALQDLGHLAEQVDFEVFQPGLTPAGYRLWKAATLVDGDGDRWLKQTFTDGVEPLFFFHGAEPAGALPEPSLTSAAVVGTEPPMDELWAYPVGRLTAIEGVLRQREVIVLGKLDAEALLDLLEFSIR
jgi:hypothetical protein